MPTARMTGMTHAIGNFDQNGCAGGTVVGGVLGSDWGIVVGVVVIVPFVVLFTIPPFVVPDPVVFVTLADWFDEVVGIVVGLVVVTT